MLMSIPHPSISIVVLAIFTGLTLISCGDDTGFHGGFAKIKESVSGEGSDESTNERTNSGEADLRTTENGIPIYSPGSDGELLWLWNCDSLAAAEEPNPHYLNGSGPHHVLIDHNSFRLNIDAEVCDAKAVPRDLMFVIDISDSMDSNDPITEGSCGRKDAIAALLESIGDPSIVNVGLVTFDAKAVIKAKTRPLNEFISDFLNTNDLCKSRIFGNTTNYRAALAPVEGLFSKDRPEALREVYFISDGKPTNGDEGASEAQSLRDSGTIIATLMLKGDDTVLQEKIASKTGTGDPLHAKTTDASKLAEKLSSLSRNEVIHADVAYRALDSNDNWLSEGIEISGNQLKNIQIAINNIERVKFPDGIEMAITYRDRRGGTYTRTGIIQWEN